MTEILETSADRSSAANKPYIQPAIVHELKLETRAGSPLKRDPLIDPLGVDPTRVDPTNPQ
jgi:hypothetical protein